MASTLQSRGVPSPGEYITTTRASCLSSWMPLSTWTTSSYWLIPRKKDTSLTDCFMVNQTWKKCVDNWSINFSDDKPMPNDDRDMLYIILGNDTIPLRNYLMKGTHRWDDDDQLLYLHGQASGGMLLASCWSLAMLLEHHKTAPWHCSAHHTNRCSHP